MPTIVLFVYGTLKRGEKNHHRMGGSRYLGPAMSKPEYLLLDLGPYPGLFIPSGNGRSIPGELWEVDTTNLALLDEFEGHPDQFERRPIELIDGPKHAHAYFYNRPPPQNSPAINAWPPSANPS